MESPGVSRDVTNVMAITLRFGGAINIKLRHIRIKLLIAAAVSRDDLVVTRGTLLLVP